jgi:DNA-directed RNA polymerase alpha subunit
MWLLNYKLYSKLLPIIFLVVIACLTCLLRSINKDIEKQESTEEDEESTNEETVVVDEEETVEVVIEADEEPDFEVTSVVSTPISQIEGLPPKTINALKEEKILTIEQLSEYTDEQLLALKGIGKKSLEKLRSFK